MRLSVISRIIKAEVCVICRSRRLRRITQTEALIILDITRKSSPIIILLRIRMTKENTITNQGKELKEWPRPSQTRFFVNNFSNILITFSDVQNIQRFYSCSDINKSKRETTSVQFLPFELRRTLRKDFRNGVFVLGFAYLFFYYILGKNFHSCLRSSFSVYRFLFVQQLS